MTRVKRIAATNIKDGDTLIAVELCRDDSDAIMLMTAMGMSIRFNSSEVPVTGRNSAGVKGIKLDTGDTVIFAGHIPEEGEILTVTDRGYMKRSFVFDHEIEGRNGKGLQCFGFKKNGSNGTRVVAAVHITVPENLVAVQLHGDGSRFNTEEVHIEPRTGKGQPMVMVLMDNVVVKLVRE